MAMRWDGFSEEDITKMKSNSGDRGNSPFKSLKAEVSLNGTRKSNSPSLKNGAARSTSRGMKRGTPSEPEIESQPQPSQVLKQVDIAPIMDSEPDRDGSEFSQDALKNQAQPTECFDNMTLDSKLEDEPSDFHNKSLTAKLVIPSLSQPNPSSLSLNDFRKKHRLMEEQNRARKLFLAKALEDRRQQDQRDQASRKKQTHAEQMRLGMIQEELQKLDQRLSCDVSIIRNQIEAASLEFMEAQKRYDRAEKEFLDAKLLLYTKLERKELLTHHLCTIIEQNEMRKAQKLSELMEKLQMPEDPTQMIEDRAYKPQECPDSKSGSGMSPDIKLQESINSDLKRKVSAEIILSPSSVVAHSDGTS